MRFRHLVGLLFLLLALSACATQAPTEAAVTASAASPQAVTPTTIAAATATAVTASADTEPTAAVTATAVVVVDECLACHTDQEKLVLTADPVEPVSESESKGVG